MFKAIIFSLTLLVPATGNSAAENIALGISASILMNKEVSIAGREILLGDIASVTSSDEALTAKLRGIHICPAAEPGLSQTLHVGYVRSRLRQHGILPESINWGGSEQIIVRTRSQVLSSREILLHVEDFIIKQMGGGGDGQNVDEQQKLEKQDSQEPRIQILPVNEIKPLILPYGELSVKVESIPGGSHNGVIPFRLIISVDDRVCERPMIFFKVTILEEILVAAHSLDRHKVIAEDDLCLALRDIGGSLAQAKIFFQKMDLVGKRTKRMIREGVAIVEDMVEDTPIINQGDVVTILIESPAFMITTQGKAREAGARNQMIRVINAASHKEIIAEVLDGNLVRVAFPG